MNPFRAPNYENGSLFNLIHSIAGALGTEQNFSNPLQQLPSAEFKDARTILFFLVDGLGYRYISDKQGSFLQQHCRGPIHSVFPTTTASAITTVMSGLCPQTHGIPGWFTYFKELGAILATLPFRTRGGRETLGAHIDSHQLFGNISFFQPGPRDLYVVTPENLADSVYSRNFCGQAQRVAFRSLEHCFEQLLTLVQREGMKYVYAYWPEFDSIAHMHGVESDQCANHFVELDRTFARFCEQAAGSDTALIVSADHGFVDTGDKQVIQLEDHPRLAQTLSMPLCGEPRTAYCYVRPKFKSQFESYVQNELQPYLEMHESATLLDTGYFGIGSVHPRFHERIGDYTLIMRDHYVINDQLLAEQVFSMVGVHGGLSDEELEIPLFYKSL